MKRALAGLVFSLTASISVLCGWLWWQRRSLPYNEEGRYFDGLVVYEEQSASVYLLMASVSLLVCLLTVRVAWRSTTGSQPS